MPSAAAPEVSVIVPFRNVEPYVGELFEALSRQQGAPAFEVIAVDNGSNDGSATIVQRFDSRLPLRVVRATDGASAAYARNVGARLARTDTLLFIDADDVVGPAYVAAMAHALEQYAFVTSRVDSRALNPPWVLQAHGSFWQTETIDVFFDFLPAAGSNIGVHASLFHKVGGFREALAPVEDIAFSWEAQLTAKIQIQLVRDAVYFYRYRHSPHHLFRQTRRWGRSQARLYDLFRDRGMPGRTWSASARDWASALSAACRPWSRASRARAAVLLGYCVGRLHGSVEGRIRYL